LSGGGEALDGVAHMAGDVGIEPAHVA
jgi:hypothetical protein